MNLNELLNHIVCPISKYPLRLNTAKTELINSQLNIAFPVTENHIPILNPKSARFLPEDDPEYTPNNE